MQTDALNVSGASVVDLTQPPALAVENRGMLQFLPGELRVAANEACRVACASCAAFMADTITPVGDQDVPLCWVCRHAVVEHGIPVANAWDTVCHHDDAGNLRSIEYVGSGDYKGRRCLCRRERFYPADVIAQKIAREAPPALVAEPEPAPIIPPSQPVRAPWRSRLSFARRRA